MNRATQQRTTIAILMLVGVGLVNTALSGIWELYSEPWAWTVYGIAVATFIISLVRQQHLSTAQTFALLALAYVAASLGTLFRL